MNNLVITIMAAGEGKRMNSNIPKVLHNFNNIPILIRIIIESLKLGPSRIIIITGKYNELIKLKIKEYFEDDIYNIFQFIQQKNPCGTGDAIKSTLDFYNDNENVLILNGDIPLIKSDTLKEFIKEYCNAKILIANIENSFGYGRIIYDKEKFIEIKEEKDCNLEEKNIKIINSGIYFFKAHILKKYIPLINNINAQNEYYLTDIFKLIIDDIDVKTYLIENNDNYQILGVNTKDELNELEKLYIKIDK
jgi:UDP-N-acetylglucosamine diphosphorylase/glucosamine-1-phosphate N-acetyltransferase